jgi:MFS family permease
MHHADAGHPRKWLILWVVALGMFMALLDSTIVNIAIPAVVTDLKTNISVVSWVLNAYNIGLAVFFLTFGRLADRYGPRPWGSSCSALSPWPADWRPTSAG